MGGGGEAGSKRAKSFSKGWSFETEEVVKGKEKRKKGRRREVGGRREGGREGKGEGEVEIRERVFTRSPCLRYRGRAVVEHFSGT